MVLLRRSRCRIKRQTWPPWLRLICSGISVSQPCWKSVRREEQFWKNYKPNSVFPETGERIICLSSQYPGLTSLSRRWNGPFRDPLFGLAPDGVFPASLLALGAVGSYPTFSPLPGALANPWRYLLCGTIRWQASRPNHPRVSRRLRGIAPCGVRTFLPSSVPDERPSVLPKPPATYPSQWD